MKLLQEKNVGLWGTLTGTAVTTGIFLLIFSVPVSLILSLHAFVISLFVAGEYKSKKIGEHLFRRIFFAVSEGLGIALFVASGFYLSVPLAQIVWVGVGYIVVACLIKVIIEMHSTHQGSQYLV